MRKHIFPTLFCLLCISLTACSGSAAVSYQPPNLPVKISIDTNGQLKVSWENSIQTPIGTFSAEISSDFSELYQDKNGVLIVNVNGVNSVYDLNGENNIVVTLESGYYRQIELRKDGNNWYFEAIRVTDVQPTLQKTSTPRPSPTTRITKSPTPQNNSNSYHPNDAASFNNHYYKVFSESLSWENAKTQCAKKGGYLVVITSNSENNFVWSLANQKSYPTYTVAWLGATDNSQEGNWQWVSGESFNPLEYLIAEGGSYENYLNLRLATGMWEDFPLAGEQVGEQWYICEWDK